MTLDETLANANANSLEKHKSIIKADLCKKSDATILFLRAARSGELSKVVEFVESGRISDINCCNANGLNALHLASKDGYIDIVTELLRRGINVNSPTKKGNTALHIASLAGQLDVVKLLIDYNANVNVQSSNGFTPLYMAAQENHYECVRLLLNKGAIPSLSTEDGFTPLAVAMQQGNDKVVAVLLETDARGKVRLPALHIAAKKNDTTTAKVLLQSGKSPDIMSKSGFTPLHIAAHYGNVEVASMLIEAGADVNFVAKHNITPLHVACKWGRKKMASLLISTNANVNATTRDGLTPLHCAARSGHVEVLELLLLNESPISTKTKNGLSALHMAAQGEHDEVARVLLDNDANVNEVTTDFLTPLHVAAHCGHVRVAQTLLNFSADVNAKALNGFSPLHIACKKNRIKLVELLLKHFAEINAATESGLTPLHVASFMGCINIVIYLLQNGAFVNSLTVRGEAPLHLAVRAKQTDIIKILLEYGAPVNVKAHEGQTPLHIAVRLDQAEIVKLLILHGADINAQTKDKYTALHVAAKEGLNDIALLLIENECNINAKTMKDFTPLHIASKYGNIDIARYLINNGADINAKGRSDITPLHVAIHYGKNDIVNLLLNHNASIHTIAKNGHNALHIATKQSNYEICKILLENGANVNSQSKTGFSPLHIATQEGNCEIVKLFLENEADVNLPSKNGLSPLHLAAQTNSPELASILLDHDATISAQTNSGFTPIHVAAYYGQINIVRVLLERKADANFATNVGYTPLHHAAQQGHTTIIKLLLRYNANANGVTHNGLTPLHLAEQLGYVTAADALKDFTDSDKHVSSNESSSKILTAPEKMQESFFSDSEDDYEITTDYQQYKYMANEFFKTPWENEQDAAEKSEDNLLNHNLSDVSYLETPMKKQIQNCTTMPINNIFIKLGFLVSFLVDARGGSMKGARNPNVRILVPPKSCAQPTRITCRFVKLEKIQNPPILMEGEALVSRIMELSPVNVNFLGPVIFEFPHFGSLRNIEREIVVLRSDNGVTWNEHFDDEAFNIEIKETGLHLAESLKEQRIVRIVTTKFPYYFAVISRIKQEIHVIGPEGGTIVSKAVPQVKAIFPQNALTKKIRVGLQAQNCINTNDLIVAASPVVTIEPRRRKFHKAITLQIPAPVTEIETSNSATVGNLRLLCSITGGQNRSLWEDVTGSTPLTYLKKNISFTTTVSARFWIINCKIAGDASDMASKLYSQMTCVPYLAKIIIFAKKLSENNFQILVFCVSDEKDERNLHYQKQFVEIARSEEVELSENQEISLKFTGDIKPVIKSHEELRIIYKPLCENKKTFTVHILNEETICGIEFLTKTLKVDARVSCIKICSLELPLNKKMQDSNFDCNNQFISTSNCLEADAVSCRDNDSLNIEKADLSLQEFCESLGTDWIKLAHKLNISSDDVDLVSKEFPTSVKKQALVMLRLWMAQNESQNTGNTIQRALIDIGRHDIVEKCILNLSLLDYKEKLEKTTYPVT